MKKSIVLCFVVLCALVVVIIPSAWADNCNDSTYAFVMSQNFVKRALKSPSTAKFPNITSDGASAQNLGGCRHQVNAYVDAQNSFGAMTRTRYRIEMQYNSDNTWSASNLRIDD
jgi:hypothetical protein